MRQLARPLMLLVTFSACAPDSQTDAERSAEAARADSSAAGYEVGPALSGRPLSSQRPDSGPRRPDSISAAGSNPGMVATGPGTSSTQPTGLVVPVTPVSGTGADSARRGSPGSTGRTPGAGKARRDSASASLPPLDPALEANFLVYDTTKKTAIFQLAASDEIAAQVSFNGARDGRRMFTVPLGWRVTIVFANRDPELPHSATIVAVTGTIPEQLPEPVFPRAQTIRVDEGLLEGDVDEILFTADRVGRYQLACGVLGHAQRGQWITLDVSTTATVPTYR